MDFDAISTIISLRRIGTHTEKAAQCRASWQTCLLFPRPRAMEKLNVMMSGHLRRLGHTDASDLARSMVAELVGTLCAARAWGINKKSDAMLHRSRTVLKQRLGL